MTLIFRDEPSPVVKQGQPVPTTPAEKIVPFDGTTLTFILMNNGREPFSFREVLRRSRVGSAFEMNSSTQLIIEEKQSFPSFSG